MIRRYFILLAEDNPGDVYLVKEAFREHGLDAEFRAVEDGEKAIDFLVEAAGGSSAAIPDLLLLDVNLPKRTGHEVLEILRRTTELQDVPVILLSSSESPSDKLQAEELGVSAWFHKATTLEEFLKLGAVAKSILAPSAGS